MMRALPTGRSGQVIALLLVLLAVAMTWRLVVAPLIELYESRSNQIEHRAMVADRLEGLAAQLPRLQASLEAGAGAAAVGKTTLDGASDALTAAMMQSDLQDLANGAGATVGTAEILPAEPVGALRRIGVRATVSGDLPTIVRLFQSIGRADPPLLLDDVQIHATVINLPGAALRLETSFALLGFRAGEGRKP